MSVSSSKIASPNTLKLQGAWATGKTPFITAPEAPKVSVVQKAAATPLQGMTPPPASAPADPAEIPHSTPLLVAVPQAGTKAANLNSDEEPESYEQLRTRLLDTPIDSLTSHERDVREAIVHMDDFVKNEKPWRTDLVATCLKLKDMTGSNKTNLKSLTDHCADDWLQLLTSTIEKFLVRLSALDAPQFDWSAITLHQIAKICYGLKACYELDYYGVSFSRQQSKPLVIAGRRITRKLIDQVHRNELIKSHTNAGDVLSLLSWIACGVHRDFKSPTGKTTMLLSGCAKAPGKVSLTDIAMQIFSYFEGRFPGSASARQIGKLFAGIDILLKQKVLVAGFEEAEVDISAERFQQAVLNWCRSPALSRPPMVASANPDLDAPADFIVVRNLLSGIYRLARHNVLEALALESIEIVNRSEQWLGRALPAPDLDLPTLKTFQRYVSYAEELTLEDEILAAHRVAVNERIKALESES